MHSDDIEILAIGPKIEELRQHYDLDGMTNSEVAQAVFKGTLRSRQYHTKDLTKNRTDSDGKEQQ